jgi:transcription initiation factor IIE alpha subunit
MRKEDRQVRIADMLRLLGKEDRTSKQLSELLGFKVNTLQHILNRLCDEGKVVKRRRKGRHIIWGIK